MYMVTSSMLYRSSQVPCLFTDFTLPAKAFHVSN
jgi:hypothetical protein